MCGMGYENVGEDSSYDKYDRDTRHDVTCRYCGRKFVEQHPGQICPNPNCEDQKHKVK
jgi:hypothetical protein